MNLLSKTICDKYNSILQNVARMQSFVVLPDGQITEISDIINRNSLLCIVPGSFNPLHSGHKSIYDKLDSFYENIKITKMFEISLIRTEKEFLSFEDLLSRLEQFCWYAPVWVTNASLFIEKTGLIASLVRPNFHIGIDTAERLLNYSGVVGVQGIAANFVVYSRIINNVKADLDSLREKYKYLPFNFKSDEKIQRTMEEMQISSTLIRNSN